MADLGEVRNLLEQSNRLLKESYRISESGKTDLLYTLQSIACSLLVIASVVADVEFEDEEENTDEK